MQSDSQLIEHQAKCLKIDDDADQDKINIDQPGPMIEDPPMNQEVDELSNSDKLQSALAYYYPHYARVNYIPIQVKMSDGYDERAMDQESHRYRCKIYFFDMYLECRDTFLTVEEAKEAVAKMALDVIVEFNRVIRDRSGDKRFGRLFAPLVSAVTENLAAHANDLEEESKIELGLPGVLSIDRYKEIESLPLQMNVLSASLSALFQKTNSPGTINPADKIVTAAQPASTITNVQSQKQSQPVVENCPHAPPQPTVDPVSAIYEHSQKKGILPPVLEEYSGLRHGTFGCRAKYDGKEYVAEAIYKNKKDARKAVAFLICKELFGDHHEGLFKTDTIAVAAKDPVFATSASITQNQTQSMPLQIQPAEKRIDTSPPAGKRFVSIINECAQVLKMKAPVFEFQTGDAINCYYIGHIKNCFDLQVLESLGLPVEANEVIPERFVGAPCTKKSDAKEDCAARYYLFLKSKGLFHEDGSIIKRLTTTNYRNQQRYFNPPVAATPMVKQTAPVQIHQVPPFPFPPPPMFPSSPLSPPGMHFGFGGPSPLPQVMHPPFVLNPNVRPPVSTPNFPPYNPLSSSSILLQAGFPMFPPPPPPLPPSSSSLSSSSPNPQQPQQSSSNKPPTGNQLDPRRRTG